jgi:uncharacterized protein YlxW (UPF0749 family)
MNVILSRVRAISTWQVTLGVALLALGFIIAAQLRSEKPRARYTSQERAPLVETSLALQAQQDALKSQILDLRDRIKRAEGDSAGSGAQIGELNSQLEKARIAAGLVALEGSGLVLQLEDSANPVPPGGNSSDYTVSGRDIRTVVEELWIAGAEAIAINGERVIAGSAIIDIGGSVLANSAYLAPPYQVAAIGPADLYERLTQSLGFIDFIHARAEGFGIQVRFAEPASVTVPAYAGSVIVRYARPLPSGSPGPSGSPSAAGDN